MSVISGNEMQSKLDKGQIFRTDTWSPDCVQEASYDLRMADDFLIVGGKTHPEGTSFPDAYVSIALGEIALLSTMELCKLPDDWWEGLESSLHLLDRASLPCSDFRSIPCMEQMCRTSACT